MATDGKLLFIRPADGTGRLTFGDGVETPIQPTGITIDATFADDMRCSVQMLWDANVSRGFAVELRTSWEEAEQVSNRARSHWQNSQPIVSLTQSNEQHAEPVSNRASVKWQESEKFTSRTAEHWQDGAAARASLFTAWQESEKLRASLRTWWQDANPVRHVALAKYQEAIRLRHAVEQHWQDADHRAYLLRHRGRSGLPIHIGLGFRWQDAMRPPAGLSYFVPPPEPPEPPCYEDIGRLEFVEPWANNGRLVFVCIRGDEPIDPGTVVVPVRSVYMTINNFSLVRLDNGYPIPATGLSLARDVDSWTWNASFSVNASAQVSVERGVSGDPVVVQATINGTPINLLLEQIGRERSFGSAQLRVQARGLSAQLDAPYAPTRSFNNEFARNARQLLDDILTINGVSIGWGITRFDPLDWLVPAGVFSHTGSYISALNAVVGSVGGYLQPQDTAQNMDVRMRYPTPSWEWASATPDLILPSAVTSREGIEWLHKPEYNRVFVIGQEDGVLGRYTKYGTAGDLLAPGVVDPLITHVDAVRQRGRTILSDTGAMANVTLSLPVLAETGIIRPGTMVRYTDGGETRIGLTRSVSVEVGMPTIYQSIQVETHV